MKYLLVKVVRIYQAAISPLLGSRCRFHPSCSEYLVGSIEKFGCLKGLVRGVKRLFKCHPFHPGGYDPVDDPVTKHNIA